MAAKRRVAVVATAQTDHRRAATELNEVEMIQPVIREVLDRVGGISEIGFTCSGSSDYLAGQAFSFVMTLDAVGAWPPIQESHVEMDGAWALYEAWLKIQAGHADTALVYSYSKASPGDLPRVMTRQLDPYYYGPLWPDSISLAGLQARAMLDAGAISAEEMAADRAPQPDRRSRQPPRPAAGLPVGRRAARHPGDVRPAARPRLPADHRRRCRRGPRRRGARR